MHSQMSILKGFDFNLKAMGVNEKTSKSTHTSSAAPHFIQNHLFFPSICYGASEFSLMAASDNEWLRLDRHARWGRSDAIGIHSKTVATTEPQPLLVHAKNLTLQCF